MKRLFSIIKPVLIIGLLTILTQVGGIIYLIYKPFSNFCKKKIKHKGKNLVARTTIFLTLFMVSSLFLIPFVAKKFGRVPLPLFSSEKYPLKPANIVTCLLNRHYVKPQLLNTIKDISQKININKKERTQIVYLDANFPFIEGFPLLPHKSHDDGEKIDIAFLFKQKENDTRLNERLSFTGYGVCVEPKKGETDKPLYCKQNGYFQYSILKTITSQKSLENYVFDEKANKEILILLARQKSIRKIFIEPHLKERLNLNSYKKIRFHGCGAVRHDDHIHIQL